MNAIETHHLTRKFGNITAVDDLNLSISQGQCFALLGVNGAGKTTAIRMLCGLIAPTKGDALILGHNIVTDAVNARALLNLSSQESAIAANLTVRENLEWICGLYGMHRHQRQTAAQNMIQHMDLGSVAHRRSGKLSGGYQRRLSIAMALITQPKVLFLDEPTLGLDVLARHALWEIINGLKGSTTLILTTHYLEEAQALADTIGIMTHGQLKAQGSASELLHRTDTHDFESAFIALATQEEIPS